MIKAVAIDKNVDITPPTKERAWFLILLLSSPPMETKLKTLREITGNTQGMQEQV
jgi:hypothetical protein